MTDHLPIVDISHHQGVVDFAKMKRQGVRGVIMRVSNGDTIDKRAATYYPEAVRAGFSPSDLLWYVFVNPKRCHADRCVSASIDYIRSITGRDDTAIMWDFEHFDREAGTSGPGLIRGAEYANYCRSLIAGVDRLAPNWRQFAYSNAAFWDHWVGKHGDDIVRRLDWIVPRYPVHSSAGYLRYPLPGVDGWADWAFARASGPFPPRGTDWEGWQFSADYNGQGPVYGCQSSALDLNIVTADAWERWTAATTPKPTPPPEVIEPPKELPDMTEYTIQFAGFAAAFHVVNNKVAPVSGPVAAAIAANGVPHFADVDHEQSLKWVLDQLGWDTNDIAPFVG